MPLVSILIPSYNHSRFLEPCLQSVRAQTLEDWEAILIDDGSSDDSVSVASRISEEEPRLRILQNKVNLGTYGTLQRALELAKGDCVAVLNSDDFWDPSKLAIQVELLENHPGTPYAYSLGWLAKATGETDDSWDVHAHWPTEEVQEPLPHLLYENRILASSVLFRKDALRFETSCRYSGDWVALLEQSQIGPTVCATRRLSFWRQHGENASLQSLPQVLEEIRMRKAILDDHLRWFLPRLDAKCVYRGLATNAINLQALYALCGLGALARKEAARALRWHPERRVIFKRCVASLLPASVLRKRLWKGRRFDVPYSTIASLPRLEFRNP